jgi:hypothetical protein
LMHYAGATGKIQADLEAGRLGESGRTKSEIKSTSVRRVFTSITTEARAEYSRLNFEKKQIGFLSRQLAKVTLRKCQLRLLSLNHRQIQRKKIWIPPDEMCALFSDALREHGNRGVSHSVHSGPPFRQKVYALNSSPAIARTEYSISNRRARIRRQPQP